MNRGKDGTITLGAGGSKRSLREVSKEPLLPLPDFVCLSSSRFKPRKGERLRADRFSYRDPPSKQALGFCLVSNLLDHNRESLRVLAPLTRTQSTPLVMVCLRRSPRARGACRASPVPMSRVLQAAVPVADSQGHGLTLGLPSRFIISPQLLSPSRTSQL